MNSRIPAGAYAGAGGPRPQGARELSGGADPDRGALVAFKTPTGRIHCAVRRSSAGTENFACINSGVTKPGADGYPWPTLVTLTDAPSVSIAEEPLSAASDSVVLTRGVPHYFGDFAAYGTAQGLTVWNTRTGHGMFLNSRGNQTF